ncbi:MAG: hypothetical protein ACJAYU_002282 [Bradymonadia bacterium]|jgi:hypothetical protein
MSSHSFVASFSCLLVAATLVACESDDSPDDTDAGVVDTSGADTEFVGSLTYQEHLRPLVEENCAGCHFDGGAAPMALDTWEEFSTWGDAAVAAVEAGTMPPWMPDDNCRPLRDARTLTADEISVFTGWLADGSAEGSEDDYIALVVDRVDLGEPDWEIAPALEYTPNLDRPDDYRCFPLDHEFTEEALIGAFDVVPGVSETVHHVIVFVVGPNSVERMEALDEEDDGPGYTCFGGPRVGSGELVAGWAPGSPPTRYPEDSAIRLAPGSRLVMQVHYSVVGVTDASTVADRTHVRLWENADAENLLLVMPFSNNDIEIPAGDAEVVHSANHNYPINARLVGLLPHMHTLGTEISLSTDDDGCLIDIPEWDFNWQQYYFFEDDSIVDFEVGDEFELTCRYDNSAANQPVVNGEQLEPRDVAWGDGTLDEMCLAFVATLVPNHPSNGGVCGPFDSCFTDCWEEDGVDCFMSCALSGGGGCLGCAAGGMQGCILANCATEGIALQVCQSNCGPLYSCSSVTCREEFDAVFECIMPHAREGECDEGLAACDVSMGE